MEKPELSKKSPYWISKHRYYELKHFCLQYPSWKQELAALTMPTTESRLDEIIRNGKKSAKDYRPVEEKVMRTIKLKNHIKLVESLTDKIDPVLGRYLLKGVTEERPYESLRVLYDIPCNRAEYYELYRKFFWLLSQKRD